jgi:tetratricopeptide (TPR) repeat protein
MSHVRLARRSFTCTLMVVACASSASASPQSRGGMEKIPITTVSDQARALYIQGRDLAEKLRATDARRLYEQAIAKDPAFALGYVALANTSGTTKEFVDATTRAAALAGAVTEGERHVILGLDAAMKGDPAGVLAHYTELVRLFPKDERAHNLLGNLYFGRQEYQAAVQQFVEATAIDPSYSQPYNQLGYAYRFLEQFDKAEAAFRKYTQLIPNDPNPYDSYGELLLKIGRFDEATSNYQKALSIDPNFVASYVGIGCVELSKGHPDQARASFAKIAAVARNTGERRLARFWTAAAYVHAGETDKALAELKAEYALAEGEQDYASMSADLNVMGDVLREAGRRDEALARYAEAVTLINKARVPESVKEATRRNHLFEQGRVAAAAGDLATAKARAAEYVRQGEAKKVPFEVRQQHELAGRIALAEKRDAAAADEFRQANQQDPVILYSTAIALKRSGDAAGSKTLAAKAAAFNGLSFNYGYVRTKALNGLQ